MCRAVPGFAEGLIVSVFLRRVRCITLGLAAWLKNKSSTATNNTAMTLIIRSNSIKEPMVMIAATVRDE